jgi:hypothetical protein
MIYKSGDLMATRLHHRSISFIFVQGIFSDFATCSNPEIFDRHGGKNNIKFTDLIKFKYV